MENRNIFWGILLVSIGGLFILDNLDILNFSFRALVDLWPLLLVGWGISIIPMKPLYKTIAGLSIAIFALVYASTNDKDFWWENNNFSGFKHGNVHINSSNNDDADDADSDNYEEETYYSFQFDEEMDAAITEAKLEMDVAAGKFRIDEAVTDHIIDFSAYSNIGPYNSNMVTNENRAEIFISMDDAIIKNGTNRNKANVKLNPAIVWDLKFNIGAADFRGDFRQFKISDIEIDGGASSIRLKIGDLLETSSIDIEAGAASIRIDIPIDAGCKIVSETFMVDLDLDGFTKNEDGIYFSDNYKESTQKINVKLEAAISQLTVNRY